MSKKEKAGHAKRCQPTKAHKSKKRDVTQAAQPKTSLRISDVEVSIFRIANGQRTEAYPILAVKSKTRKVPGFQEAQGFIEVEAGQRFGMEIKLQKGFDFMKQATVAASFCTDGGNFCTTSVVQTSEVTDDNWESKCSFQETNAGHGFRFVERPISEGVQKTARGQQDQCGVIELQVERGTGRLISVTEKNHFGESYKKDTPQFNIIATEFSATKEGKQLYTEVHTNGDDRTAPSKWLDWAYAEDLPEPLLKKIRKQNPVYELITISIFYRLRAYLECKGIKPMIKPPVCPMQEHPFANSTEDADSTEFEESQHETLSQAQDNLPNLFAGRSGHQSDELLRHEETQSVRFDADQYAHHPRRHGPTLLRNPAQEFQNGTLPDLDRDEDVDITGGPQDADVRVPRSARLTQHRRPDEQDDVPMRDRSASPYHGYTPYSNPLHRQPRPAVRENHIVNQRLRVWRSTNDSPDTGNENASETLPNDSNSRDLHLNTLDGVQANDGEPQLSGFRSDSSETFDWDSDARDLELSGLRSDSSETFDSDSDATLH